MARRGLAAAGVALKIIQSWFQNLRNLQRFETTSYPNPAWCFTKKCQIATFIGSKVLPKFDLILVHVWSTLYPSLLHCLSVFVGSRSAPNSKCRHLELDSLRILTRRPRPLNRCEPSARSRPPRFLTFKYWFQTSPSHFKGWLLLFPSHFSSRFMAFPFHFCNRFLSFPSDLNGRHSTTFSGWFLAFHSHLSCRFPVSPMHVNCRFMAFPSYF